MLRFSVYDKNGPAGDWPLVNAHLLGPDDLALPGKVAFRDGVIACRRPGKEAAALCLQHDAGRMGRLMLQTCLLPDREEPYHLAVELARHRIKMFIAKSEEWQMFDLASDHPAMTRWEEARKLFTTALTADDPMHAEAAASKALARAIDATERLAMAHAEILLHKRFGSRAATSAALGVRVWPGRDGKQLREFIAANFDVVVLPLRWRELEVEEGVYDWGPVDRWMEWAKAEGKPIIAGPLLDFSKAALPEWMYVWQHDYDTCRDLVYDYMSRVVERYRGVVGMWNIGSGLNVNDNFTFTPPQMLDLARTASLLVRQFRKGARTMIELRQPFGEHCAVQADSMPPLAFVDRLLQEGIKFDALGVQFLFGSGDSGRASRDLMQMSSFLDRLFMLEIPVLVSALGVPSAGSDAAGGWWHQAWSPEVQAKWVGPAFVLAMSKPYVESVFWTDLYDHPDALVAGAGLITDEGRPKPALARLVGARRRLRKPLGVPRSMKDVR
jgi:GH35 family endo-1,4-beta-xylanase